MNPVLPVASRIQPIQPSDTTTKQGVTNRAAHGSMCFCLNIVTLVQNRHSLRMLFLIFRKAIFLPRGSLMFSPSARAENSHSRQYTNIVTKVHNIRLRFMLKTRCDILQYTIVRLFVTLVCDSHDSSIQFSYRQDSSHQFIQTSLTIIVLFS